MKEKQHYRNNYNITFYLFGSGMLDIPKRHDKYDTISHTYFVKTISHKTCHSWLNKTNSAMLHYK